ncbi:MAG: PEP-CTERM sorting domain-containing protein [Pirellulaceae bacterium]
MNSAWRSGILAVAMGAAAMFCAPRPATAAFKVTLSAGNAFETITDGEIGKDFDGVANGTIQVFNKNLGGYLFTFEMATTNSDGANSLAFVNSSAVFISDEFDTSLHGLDGFDGMTTIRILASANDFDAPLAPPDLRVDSKADASFFSSTPNGHTAQISYNAYVDASNTIAEGMGGIGGTLVGSGGQTITVPIPSSTSNLNDVDLIGFLEDDYTITLELIAVLGQGGSTINLGGDVRIVPTPEPATLTLWGAGLIGAAVFGRYRRRRS